VSLTILFHFIHPNHVVVLVVVVVVVMMMMMIVLYTDLLK
jgi:hypothetical protein